MFHVQALIFAGNRQQLICQHCESEAAFFAQLQALFGVYVCLWYETRAAVTDSMTGDATGRIRHAVT